MEDRYLFKAKRIDNGEWVLGALFDGESHCIIGQEIKFSPYIEHECKIVGYEVDRNTICQCTGLRDKNGKLIWENDIIKKEFYTDYDSVYQEEYVTSVIFEEYIGAIKFEYFAWVVEIFNDHLKCILPICELSEHSEDIKYFEVIGNIFDNPELGGTTNEYETNIV